MLRLYDHGLCCWKSIEQLGSFCLDVQARWPIEASTQLNGISVYFNLLFVLWSTLSVMNSNCSWYIFALFILWDPLKPQLNTKYVQAEIQGGRLHLIREQYRSPGSLLIPVSCLVLREAAALLKAGIMWVHVSRGVKGPPTPRLAYIIKPAVTPHPPLSYMPSSPPTWWMVSSLCHVLTLMCGFAYFYYFGGRLLYPIIAGDHAFTQKRVHRETRINEKQIALYEKTYWSKGLINALNPSKI